MVQLCKIPLKKMFATKDGKKFETLEDAQIHNKILEFREKIGINIFDK